MQFEKYFLFLSGLNYWFITEMRTFHMTEKQPKRTPIREWCWLSVIAKVLLLFRSQ